MNYQPKMTTDPAAIEQIEKLRDEFSKSQQVTVTLADGNTFRGRSSYGHIAHKSTTGHPEHVGGFVRVVTPYGEMTIDSLDIGSWSIDA